MAYHVTASSPPNPGCIQTQSCYEFLGTISSLAEILYLKPYMGHLNAVRTRDHNMHWRTNCRNLDDLLGLQAKTPATLQRNLSTLNDGRRSTSSMSCSSENFDLRSPLPYVLASEAPNGRASWSCLLINWLFWRRTLQGPTDKSLDRAYQIQKPGRDDLGTKGNQFVGDHRFSPRENG